MPPAAKPKPGRKFTGKQAAIALGIAGLLIVGYVIYRRRQAASAAPGDTATVPGGDVGAGGTLPFPSLNVSGAGGGVSSPAGGGGSVTSAGSESTAPPPGDTGGSPPGSWEWHCNTSQQTTILGPPGSCGWLWVDPTCGWGEPSPFADVSGCRSTTGPPGSPPKPAQAGAAGSGGAQTADTIGDLAAAAQAHGQLDYHATGMLAAYQPDPTADAFGAFGAPAGQGSPPRLIDITQSPTSRERPNPGPVHGPFPVVGQNTGGV